MVQGKKEFLLKAGEKMFAERGYRHVTVEDISRSIGIATGSFYSHFSGKEAFYSEVLDRLEIRVKQKADQVIGRFRSPLNKLKALYRLLTLGIRKNPILKGILTDDPRFLYPGWSERRNHESGLRRHIETQISAIIREGTRRRIFRSGLFHDPKQMITGLFNTILFHVDEDNIETLIDDILLLLERGFKRRLRLRKRDERKDRRTGKKALEFGI